ncbi:MAG: endonuclease/exonuclease/phosphatase family protein [Actinomyces sp.]|nr:endonuclease/exonuclease/phosphatase family protein [Actinomyces sp.]
MTLTVTTVNLNGIRAAHKRGFLDWLEASDTDVLLMQEVRAPEEISREIMGEAWDSVWVPCRIKGRAGVGVAVRRGRAVLEGEPRPVLDGAETDVDSGRWLEAIVRPEGGETPVRVVSAYFHSGEKDTPKQEAKMAHLPRIGTRMAELIAEEAAGGISSLVCGDFNVVRSEADIKNWKPNHNKRAGVLDEEIAFLNQWVVEGWRDAVRDLAAPGPPRVGALHVAGQAFVNNAGWRIDYQYATPALGERARSFAIGRADEYAERFSDHAPVSVTYEI